MWLRSDLSIYLLLFVIWPLWWRLALLTVIGLSRVGGWSELTTSAPEGFLSMVKPIDHPDYPITGFMFGNLFVEIFYWCMDQAIVQRALGARNIDHGRKGAIFGGFLKILPVFIFALPGVIAVVLFPDIEHDKAFPTLVSELLPAGIKGLVLAGLLAALMSSLDSTLNASATLVTRDFFVRFTKTEPSQAAQIWLGRITIVVVVIAGILWAPVITKAETIWKYLQMVSAYMAVPIAAAVLTGILWRRGNNAGALSAMVFGVAGRFNVERGPDTNFTDSDYGLIYASFSRCIFAQRSSNGRRQLTHCRPI